MPPGDPPSRALDRVTRALQEPAKPSPALPAEPNRSGPSGAVAGITLATGAVTGTLLSLGLVTHHPQMLVASALSLVVGGALALVRRGPQAPRSATSQPHIGMGASVASTATIEAGVTVEMGASVAAGAILKRGATVRMGSSVGKRAVIEEGATISWGVSVGRDAVVGAGSTVGAGSSIGKGARVPPNLRLSPGTNWSASSHGQLEPAPAAAAAPVLAAAPVDPRAARIDACCDRLDAELGQASPAVREYLGTSIESVAALRTTCHQLLAREKVILEAASPSGIAGLEAEAKALNERIASETDPAIRRSLGGAVAAIEDQRKQREMLSRSADRVAAEVTRLTWTLEGIGTQLVRLRTAGAEAASGDGADITRMAQQLHDEIDAIADALEQVNQPGDPLAQPTSVTDVVSPGAGQATDSRERSRT